MRYDCDDPAFVGDYLELSDSWSRAQVRAIWGAIPDDTANADEAEETFLALLRPKVLRVHLTCVDAEPITDVAELVPARTEQMDTRLYAWFGMVWVRHLSELANLGNALRRSLVATSATTTQTEPDPQSRNHS
jgi:hypothetical protein